MEIKLSADAAKALDTSDARPAGTKPVKPNQPKRMVNGKKRNNGRLH